MYSQHCLRGTHNSSNGISHHHCCRLCLRSVSVFPVICSSLQWRKLQCSLQKLTALGLLAVPISSVKDDSTTEIDVLSATTIGCNMVIEIHTSLHQSAMYSNKPAAWETRAAAAWVPSAEAEADTQPAWSGRSGQPSHQQAIDIWGSVGNGRGCERGSSKADAWAASVGHEVTACAAMKTVCSRENPKLGTDTLGSTGPCDGQRPVSLSAVGKRYPPKPVSSSGVNSHTAESVQEEAVPAET
jgi:hypothetical protein